MNDVGGRAGRARPVAHVLVVLVEDPVFRLVPADLERNHPSEVAVLGVLADVRELVPAHHRAVDASHVHALVGMRISGVGMERVMVIRVVFVAKVRMAYSVPRKAPDDLDAVAQRLDAKFSVVDPENVQHLLLAEAALAGRRLGLPWLRAKRKARRRLG